MCSNELKATFVSHVIVNVLRIKIAIPPPRPVTLGTCKTVKLFSEIRMSAMEVLTPEQSQVSVTASMSKWFENIMSQIIEALLFNGWRFQTENRIWFGGNQGWTVV